QVDVVRIPYDPSLPYYVVTVEPLSFDASGEGGGSAPPVPGRRYGWGPWGWGLLPEGPQARPYNPPPQGASGNMGSAIASQIVSPSSGRLVGSVVANGSFTSESAASGFSLFGVGKASNAFAASALGQANRAAMNSATTQIVDRLRSVR